jgi:hypothetical protein
MGAIDIPRFLLINYARFQVSLVAGIKREAGALFLSKAGAAPATVSESDKEGSAISHCD